MSPTYENPVAWRRAGLTLAETFLLTVALSAAAIVPLNGGPVTQATTPDNSASAPNTLVISSPAVSDVVKMVDAKVDTAVIKAFIQNANTTYNPSAGDLIALKNHGVPDEVLTAMLERGGQVRSQLAQGLQQPPAPAQAAPAPAPAPTYAAPAANYASYPADSSTYGAPYADYSYAYPAAYSYPYSYSYSYGYPYYSYYWPYYGYPYCGYGYYGHSYCGYHGYYGHGGYGCYNGYWHGNHTSPHSAGNYVNHSNGFGRPGPYTAVGTQSRPANFAMSRGPAAPVGARPANFAMNRGASAPMSSAARPASFAARTSGFHGGGSFSGHVGGGGARVGGGGGFHGGGGGGHR